MPFRDAPDHVQSAILPPDVLEAVVRIGWVAESGHLQVQLEAADVPTGVLLMLKSVPAVRPVTPETLVQVVVDLVYELWYMQIAPEPF